MDDCVGMRRYDRLHHSLWVQTIDDERLRALGAKALEFFPCARGSGDVVTGSYEKGNEPPAHDPRSPGKEDPHAYTLPEEPPATVVTEPASFM